MMRAGRWSFVALAASVFASAVAAVYAKHENRKLFAELQMLIDARDQLEVDWSRLQMEQSTWSTHARVEEQAREQMHMRNPAADEIRMVVP
jgi:cell division protein FtsL